MGTGLLPCLAMITVELGLAVMNIITKLAMDSGLDPFVLVTYRQIIAAVTMAPFAYFFERKKRPRITKHILFQCFLCSILGATMSQGLYFLGLKHTTPTIACALANLLPAITFIMAVLFRTESIEIKRQAGQAKVMGTVLCISGAMLITFYKGKILTTWQLGLHWNYVKNIEARSSSNNENTILGPLLVLAGCFTWAGWYIVQAKASNTFKAPYWSTMMMTSMASLECAAIGAILQHHVKKWFHFSNMNIIAILYSGVIGSGFAFYLTSWGIEKRGPLYASAFSPLQLVIVAIFDWALLDDKLHIGSAVGSVLIVVGLYTVLWGKEKEMTQMSQLIECTIQSTECMEHVNIGDMKMALCQNEGRDDFT